MDTDAIITALVELHGTGGLSHPRDGWARILEPHRGRIRVVNLLGFHDRVQVATRRLGGREAYAEYLAATATAFGRVGGRLITRGEVFDTAGFDTAGFDAGGLNRDDPHTGPWDTFVVSEYPSGDALARMWLDPEFVSAHRYRTAAVARSMAVFSTTRRP